MQLKGRLRSPEKYEAELFPRTPPTLRLHNFLLRYFVALALHISSDSRVVSHAYRHTGFRVFSWGKSPYGSGARICVHRLVCLKCTVYVRTLVEIHLLSYVCAILVDVWSTSSQSYYWPPTDLFTGQTSRASSF